MSKHGSSIEFEELNDGSSGFFYHQLYKKILFIEVIVVAVNIGLHLSMLIARPDYGFLNSSDTNNAMLFNRWTIAVILLFVYLALSRISLVEKGFAPKVSILIGLILLAVLAFSIGLGPFVFPLIAVTVGKATILLERIAIWWVCAFSYGAFLVGLVSRNLIRNLAWREAFHDPGAAIVFAGGALVFSFNALIIIVLVASLVRALVDARKQLVESERLSKELAEASANLERLRIAQDLHDSVGHSLTSLKLQLEVAKKLFTKKPEDSKKSLDTAFELSRTALADVRNAVSVMKIEDFRFNDSLKKLMEELSALNVVSVNCDVDLPEDLIDSKKGYQLFRVIQEACTNVLKHAEAKLILITASLKDDELTIVIFDDGKGFDTEQSDSGNGLSGMCKRMESISGSFTIESKLTVGTTIKLTMEV